MKTSIIPPLFLISGVDSEGNVVSVVQSLFYAFGSGLVDLGMGVLFNVRVSYFKFYGLNVVLPFDILVYALSSLLLENDDKNKKLKVGVCDFRGDGLSMGF